MTAPIMHQWKRDLAREQAYALTARILAARNPTPPPLPEHEKAPATPAAPDHIGPDDLILITALARLPRAALLVASYEVEIGAAPTCEEILRAVSRRRGVTIAAMREFGKLPAHLSAREEACWLLRHMAGATYDAIAEIMHRVRFGARAASLRFQARVDAGGVEI